MVLMESHLHRMQFVIPGYPLDSRDICTLRLHCKHRAALHRAAIQMHDAGTALTRVTSHVRPGLSEIIAEQLDQQRATFDCCRPGFAIYGYRDFAGHWAAF
jgi:hypothetical protein